MILVDNPTHNYAMYIHLEGEYGKGFNREFFRNKKCAGAKHMLISDLEVSRVTTGSSALQKIENLIITKHWLSINEHT
jgi:hypothetical protein